MVCLRNVMPALAHPFGHARDGGFGVGQGKEVEPHAVTRRPPMANARQVALARIVVQMNRFHAFYHRTTARSRRTNNHSAPPRCRYNPASTAAERLLGVPC